MKIIVDKLYYIWYNSVGCMSKIEKILSKWENPPPLTNLREVLSVLNKFGFDIDNKRGSHKIVSHPCLIGHKDFPANGEITIPTVKGRSVKNVI